MGDELVLSHKINTDAKPSPKKVVYSLTRHLEIADDCENAVFGEESRSVIAVAVLAANCPDYFRKVLDSLSHQTVDNFKTYLFVDNVTNSEDNKKVLELARNFNPGGGVYNPKENYGQSKVKPAKRVLLQVVGHSSLTGYFCSRTTI